MGILTVHPPRGCKKQRGATLLVALILLLMLTLLAIAAARTSTLQQRMSGNLQIKTTVFTAAENGISLAILRLRENQQDWPEENTSKYLCATSLDDFPQMTGSTCTLPSNKPYYQSQIKRVACQDQNPDDGCFEITGFGYSEAGFKASHQLGYIFSVEQSGTTKGLLDP